MGMHVCLPHVRLGTFVTAFDITCSHTCVETRADMFVGAVALHSGHVGVGDATWHNNLYDIPRYPKFANTSYIP